MRRFNNKVSKLLTYFMSLISFFTPWKLQKTRGFLVFSGILERDQWHDIGWNVRQFKQTQIVRRFIEFEASFDLTRNWSEINGELYFLHLFFRVRKHAGKLKKSRTEDEDVQKWVIQHKNIAKPLVRVICHAECAVYPTRCGITFPKF